MHDPHGTHHKDNDVCGTHREGQLLTQRPATTNQYYRSPRALGPAPRYGRKTT